MHNHTQARNERSLRTNIPHNDKPRSGDIICRSDNIATAWLSLVRWLVSVSRARSSLAYGYAFITTAWLPKVETRNPVRDSTKITDRKCGAHAVCGVFRRTVYLLYNQPQSGLHNIYPCATLSRVEAVWQIVIRRKTPHTACAPHFRSVIFVESLTGFLVSLLHKK